MYRNLRGELQRIRATSQLPSRPNEALREFREVVDEDPFDPAAAVALVKAFVLKSDIRNACDFIDAHQAALRKEGLPLPQELIGLSQRLHDDASAITGELRAAEKHLPPIPQLSSEALWKSGTSRIANDLAALLKERFGLRDAVVVPAATGDSLYHELGKGAAEYFSRNVSRNFRIGFACANSIHSMVKRIKPFRLGLDAYPISFNVVPELTSVMSSYAALIELWMRNPECRAHAINLPSFFLSEAERHQFESRRDVQAVLRQVRDLNMAFYSCGGFGPGSSFDVVRSYINEFIDPHFDPAELRQLGACGEINWHPFTSTGEIVPHAVPYSFGYVDLGTLKRLALQGDRHMVLVAGGPQKIHAILGALRGGFQNVLVTDEGTLNAVATLDAELG